MKNTDESKDPINQKSIKDIIKVVSISIGILLLILFIILIAIGIVNFGNNSVANYVGIFAAAGVIVLIFCIPVLL